MSLTLITSGRSLFKQLLKFCVPKDTYYHTIAVCDSFDEFTCTNGDCIKCSRYVVQDCLCDGGISGNDCDDNSDEINCGKFSCVFTSKIML